MHRKQHTAEPLGVNPTLLRCLGRTLYLDRTPSAAAAAAAVVPMVLICQQQEAGSQAVLCCTLAAACQAFGPAGVASAGLACQYPAQQQQGTQTSSPIEPSDSLNLMAGQLAKPTKHEAAYG
jgi:hypothetical protein